MAFDATFIVLLSLVKESVVQRWCLNLSLACRAKAFRCAIQAFTSCFIGLDISIIFWSQLCLGYLKWRAVVQVFTHLAEVKPRGQCSCVVISLLGLLDKGVWYKEKNNLSFT